MARSFRSALLYAALLSTATAALVMGCADSTDSDFDSTSDAGASTDSGKKDGRASDDGSTSEEDEDGGSNPKKDSGTKEAGGNEDDDAGPDAGSDAETDAGDTDAGDGDAGDGGGSDGGETDAGEAGVDGGEDAGDSGSSTAIKPAQGDVVISEVMYNPSAAAETDAEWIELYNTTAEPRLLGGLVLKDGADRTHTIRPGLVIAPGAYVVLASTQAGVTAANVPAGVIVYDYNTGVPTTDKVQLSNNTNGKVSLLDGATEIARANYGPTTGNGGLGLSSADNGQSIQLKTLTYAAAGLKASWCYSPNVWVAGSDKGTPGAASDCN